MFYRSDWPEVGLSGPVIDAPPPRDSQVWQRFGYNKWRWVSQQDDFESQLYGIPVWSLHLELWDTGGGWLAEGLSKNGLPQRLRQSLQQLLEEVPWPHAYVATKVVKEEPLWQSLADAGFEQVEHRCLFKTKVKHLHMPPDSIDSSIRYLSLAAADTDQRDRIREEILEICHEGFQRGYSRHFADGFLVERVRGLSYILGVMKRNFERVPLHLILLAVDKSSERLCGFSMLKQRPGHPTPHYTQLLSAVREAYRGKRIYAGLTLLLRQVLPEEALLMNVTHSDNQAMQRAYEHTGRVRYVDTLVMRRIFGPAGKAEVI